MVTFKEHIENKNTVKNISDLKESTLYKLNLGYDSIKMEYQLDIIAPYQFVTRVGGSRLTKVTPVIFKQSNPKPNIIVKVVYMPGNIDELGNVVCCKIIEGGDLETTAWKRGFSNPIGPSTRVQQRLRDFEDKSFDFVSENVLLVPFEVGTFIRLTREEESGLAF